jgi:phage baseplate assembly protein W
MTNPPSYLDFPLSVDARGRISTTDVDDHVRDLIMAVLFTSPGERVGLPEFGCGIAQLVFAPNSDLLASATEALAGAALNRWLNDWIIVQKLEVVSEEAILRIRLSYIRRDTQEPQQLEIVR